MPFTTNDRKALAFSGAAKYHQQGYKGHGINIGVIDSGINDHPELTRRIRYDLGRNFCTVATDAASLQEDDARNGGHGTAVASLIAGLNCGVAPMATVTPLKVFNGLMECTDEWIIAALNYVRTNADKFDIINMSLGTQTYSFAMEQAVNAVVAAGIPVIVSAGNSGDERHQYPACFEQVISVGAVDIDKQRATYTTMCDEVDLCQVGTDIKVAALSGDYTTMSGTSFAAPIVSGVASLIACKFKSLFGRRILETVLYEALKLSSIDVDIPGIDKASGVGLCTLGAGRHVLFAGGSTEYRIDGEPRQLDSPMIYVNNRTMLPARYLAEALGSEIFANGDNTVSIIG